MKPIPLYIGYEHDCDYLPGRRAQMAYVSPRVPLDRAIYTRLAASGFRRSGEMVYRPYCRDCSACVPVRIPVQEFRPNRSQRRVEKANADLTVTRKLDVFDEEHYQLYMRYLRSRHPEGHMVLSSREDYIQFVASEWGIRGFMSSAMAANYSRSLWWIISTTGCRPSIRFTIPISRAAA